MIRSMLCCAVVFGAGSVASAGELDKEVAPVKSGITAGVLKSSASEMDTESPTDAWHRRGYWGHHHHHHHHHGYVGYGFGYNAYRPAYYSPYIGYRGYNSYYGGGFYGSVGYGFRGGYVGFGYRGW